MLDVAGAAGGEVIAKRRLGVRNIAALDQEPGEMRSADEALVGNVAGRTLVGTLDAGALERIRDSPRALVATGPNRLEAFLQYRARRVDAQGDDVQRDVVPTHR